MQIDRRRHSAHRSRGSHRAPGSVRRFFSRFKFEIVWVAIMLLGAFLLFERMHIRSSIIRSARGALSQLGVALGALDDVARSLVTRIAPSDAIGLVLVLAALCAFGWRIRWRLLNTPALALPQCPECKSQANRVHRTSTDRVLNCLVPVHRYRCVSPDCAWEGLRINDGKRRGNQHRSVASSSL